MYYQVNYFHLEEFDIPEQTVRLSHLLNHAMIEHVEFPDLT